MKKLFLLLAGLAVMVACNDPKSGPDPDPGPEPGKDPVLSKTELTMNFNTSEKLTVLNYTGAVVWTTTDDFSAVVQDGTVIGCAIGTADIIATLADGKELKCKIIIEPLHKTAAFLPPVLEWSADAEAIKAKETRKFELSDPWKNQQGTQVGTIEIYTEDGFDAVYPNQFEYGILTVADEDGNTGMVKASVFMPTDVGTKEETQQKLQKVWQAIGERYYFIGITGQYDDQIFMNKEKTYSFLANTYNFNQEQTIVGWGCEHVNITDWVPSSTQANVFQLPAGFNYQRPKGWTPFVTTNKLLRIDYLK